VLRLEPPGTCQIVLTRVEVDFVKTRHFSMSLSALVLIAGLCLGQASSEKKAHSFHGKVESIDRNTRSLIVNGDKVEGWMDAMTMTYKVDNPSILDKVRPGDQITATVYDGDYSLHKVQIVGRSAPDSKSRK
jgi:Cu/Ag efflux protein CusF